jgi:hypothetical protein
MMARVPPKPSGKGMPPAPGLAVGNLDKPDSDGYDTLNFKPPKGFRREYQLFAAHHGMDMVEVLQPSFELFKATIEK